MFLAPERIIRENTEDILTHIWKLSLYTERIFMCTYIDYLLLVMRMLTRTERLLLVYYMYIERIFLIQCADYNLTYSGYYMLYIGYCTCIERIY